MSQSTESETIYVPIIKTKRGELRGLRKLDAVTQVRVTPLVAIHRISKYPEDKIKDTLEGHLTGLGGHALGVE